MKKYLLTLLFVVAGVLNAEEPAGYAVFIDDAETVYPLLRGQNSLPVAVPQFTGAEEFTVQAPNSGRQIVVSVADFGATPNNPDNTKAFNDAIAHCVAVGATRLVVPHGTYRFTTDASLRFNRLSDFVFNGQGSTFIFKQRRNHYMTIDYCERTEFRNFSLDWDWDNDPLASVVKVEQVEASGQYLDLDFVDYELFPVREVGLRGMLELDPATMSVGVENGFFLGLKSPKYEWLGPKRLRIFSDDRIDCMKKTWFKAVRPGTLFRLMHRNLGIGAIILGNNSHLTLADVNVYSVPGPAIGNWGDQHHWQFLRVRVTRPDGSKRPLSSSSDHCDVYQTNGYFKMENCEFAWGFDDGLNITGAATGQGVAAGPCTITTRRIFNLNPYHEGDPIELRQDDYAPTGFEARIKTIKTIDAAKGIHEFTFAESLPAQKGKIFLLFNHRNRMKNVIIRHCYFHDNQARGMLLHGENMTVENNRFFHNQLGAIHITTGYTLTDWTEGQGAANIVVRNNLFDTVNPQGFYPQEKYPAIKIYAYLKTDPSPVKTRFPLFRNILFENNRFINLPGVVAYICSAENIVFRKNAIQIAIPRKDNLPYRGSFATACASKLFYIDNQWLRSPYQQEPVLLADPATVKEVYTDGNRWDALQP